MTTVFTLRTLFRLFIFSALVLSFQPNSFGQVPVDEVESNPSASEAQAGQALPLEDSGFGVLSDPSELGFVDGLDEELERLRLRDQDGTGILDMIQLITGRYILRPQNLPAVKINFDSFTVLTKRETLRALESLLAMNGIGITKIDDQFFKAVPASGMNVHVPIWLDGPALAIKPSQRIYVKMFHLEYAPALEVREQLNPFSTPNVGTLLVFEKANSIFATDSLLNLQRMEKLLESIDRPISKEELGTEFFIWEAEYAGAKELEGKLKTMVEGSLKPFLGGTTQVDSDDRTGKLIVVTRKENLETIKFLLETLDSPVKVKATSEHFKLQHAEAKDIKSILDEVIKSQKAVKEKVQKSKSSRPLTGSANNATSKEGVGTNSESGTDGSHEFSDLITIAANERGNGILVYGTKSDLVEIKRMIDSLDEPLPLAKIETIFMMVDISADQTSGIQSLFNNLKYNKRTEVNTEDGDALDPRTGERRTVTEPTLSGVVKLPLLNSDVEFSLSNWNLTGITWNNIFSAASNRSDVRVFSSPSLMVSHNNDNSAISVGREITYVTTTYNNTDVRGNENTVNVPQTTPQRITAETSLQISKPKIGLPVYDKNNPTKLVKPGSIFMEVEVEANKFDLSSDGSNNYDGQRIPGRVTRKAQSVITAKSGDIIVLGGLQETITTEVSQKYNLLSNLPYLGKKLFSPQNTTTTPSELLIFIKPTVYNPDQSVSDENFELINSRMSSGYEPVFTAPTGKTLIDSKLIKTSSGINHKDTHSNKPLLN